MIVATVVVVMRVWQRGGRGEGEGGGGGEGEGEKGGIYVLKCVWRSGSS